MEASSDMREGQRDKELMDRLRRETKSVGQKLDVGGMIDVSKKRRVVLAVNITIVVAIGDLCNIGV